VPTAMFTIIQTNGEIEANSDAQETQLT
jgi:hypothetical protein